MKLVTFVAALLTATAHNAIAADPYFKAPFEFAGTGCPTGSIAVVGENSPTLTVMFDSYDAGNGMTSKSGMPRTACSFAVPVHVPPGMQVSKVTADWMGYSKGSTKMKRTYFFAHNPTQSRKDVVSNFPPPNGSDFTRSDVTNPYFTCGPEKDIILRIKSSIEANGTPSYIAADSVDLNNKVIFRIEWIPCR